MILVIYDVSDNKRRRRIVKLLESYGKRVQKSAFECNISAATAKDILKKAERWIDVNCDSVRLYTMNSYNTLASVGINVQVESEDFAVV